VISKIASNLNNNQIGQVMSTKEREQNLSQKVSVLDVDYFKKNGFLKVKNLFPEETINSIASEIKTSDTLKNADGAIFDLINDRKELRYVPRPHVVLPSLQKLVNSNVFALSSNLLNEDVYFVGIDLHCRAAGTEHPTPPHQDSFLFCLEAGFESLVTCAISMSGMDAESASLRFIKGSHLLPTLQHKQSSIRGFSSVIEENSNLLSKDMLEKEEIISLEKGECVFFHAKTIHYTNQTSKPTKGRTSVSIRIGGCNVKYSAERQKQYEEFVAFNRLNTLKEGLTSAIPKPQHN
jgi:ectoine hydroxylase-related dioxygenase (phytanoyl-CoA dioxygenase family)